MRNGSVSEFVLSQFAEDVTEEGLTFSEVDYGFAQWRRKRTSFTPTFGEFLDLIVKGRADKDGPGIAFSARYRRRLKRILDPEHSRRKTEPAKTLADQYTESRNLLHRMESEKKAGGYTNSIGEWKEWSETCEIMLKGVQSRVLLIESKLRNAS